MKYDHELEYARQIMEAKENWRQLSISIPTFTVSSQATIKVIPPFGGATARFIIARKDMPGKNVSVYMDHFSRLGCMDNPYYEAYPIDGDTSRYPCTQEGMDEMMKEIHNELQLEYPQE